MSRLVPFLVVDGNPQARKFTGTSQPHREKSAVHVTGYVQFRASGMPAQVRQQRRSVEWLMLTFPRTLCALAVVGLYGHRVVQLPLEANRSLPGMRILRIGAGEVVADGASDAPGPRAALVHLLIPARPQNQAFAMPLRSRLPGAGGLKRPTLRFGLLVPHFEIDPGVRLIRWTSLTMPCRGVNSEIA